MSRTRLRQEHRREGSTLCGSADATTRLEKTRRWDALLKCIIEAQSSPGCKRIRWNWRTLFTANEGTCHFYWNRIWSGAGDNNGYEMVLREIYSGLCMRWMKPRMSQLCFLWYFLRWDHAHRFKCTKAKCCNVSPVKPKLPGNEKRECRFCCIIILDCFDRYLSTSNSNIGELSNRLFAV